MIPSRFALGVDEVGWGEPCGVVGEGDVPLAAVDESVVLSAEQDEVVQGGGSSLEPFEDVVCVADARRSGATRECASFVSEDQSASYVRGDGVGGDCDVEWFGVSAHHCRQYVCIAGDASGFSRGQLCSWQDAAFHRFHEFVHGDGERDFGLQPVVGR